MSYLSDPELIQEIDDLTPVFSRNFAAQPVLNPEIADEITFTRSTTSTRVNELGLIADAGVDVPRFDYTPNLRTNRHTSSEVFNANTSLGNAVITSTTELSPTSTNNATRFRTDTANAIHRIVDARYSQVPTGTIITCSCYVKADGYNYFVIQIDNGKQCFFDLVGGVVVGYTGAGVGTITAAANGYWRVTFTVTTSIASSDIRWTISPDGTTVTFTGDGVGGVIIWGAQLETGAITPYQATPNTIAGPVCKGLLIEEARTNLVSHSATLSSWGLINTTTSAAPSSPMTIGAFKVEEAATTSFHLAQGAIASLTGGTAYTASVFLAPAERTSGQIVFFRGGDFCVVSFNLSTVTVTASSVSNFTTATNLTITPYANGYYRVSFTTTPTNSGTGIFEIRLGTTSYAGTAGFGLYAVGAQVEAGTFATSPITTAGGSVTRAADVCSVTGTNFSRWWNPSEFTILTRCFGLKSVGGPVGLINNAAAVIAINGANVVSDMFGTLVLATGALNTYSNFVTCARAVKFSTSDSVLVNQGTVAIQTLPITPLSPAETGMTIGYRGNGGNYICGHVEFIRVYPKRLSNRLLKAITLP